MSVTELVQLYAPLVGLMGMAFWLGVMNQRVKGLEAKVMAVEAKADADVKALESDVKTDVRAAMSELRSVKDASGESKNAERLVRLETQMGAVVEGQGVITRSLENLHRQIGNIVIKGGATVGEFSVP